MLFSVKILAYTSLNFYDFFTSFILFILQVFSFIFLHTSFSNYSKPENC